MIKILGTLLLVTFFLIPAAWAQTAPQVSPADVWNVLSAPAMDPEKSAHAENVEIQRDRVKITLTDGTIQFAKPANGVVFAAVFHGIGKLQTDPPNPIEAQQLRLFTKQDRLDMGFTEATFSFTDGIFDEVARQVKWQPNGPAADDSYAKRQQERESLGESVLPRLLQSVLSAERAKTAYFLADLKTKDKGWVEAWEDALSPEEVTVGRWVDLGPVKRFDIWMSFPASQRASADAWKDPQEKADFIVRGYKVDATVTGGAELRATTRVTLEPRLAGQAVLLFNLDANLRVEAVTDTQGKTLSFLQARETKDRYQSYGDYVAVVLPSAFPVGQSQTLEFRYAGKRAIRKAGNGNYFCESSGWYPERGESFGARSDFELTFHSPKNLVLVATGEKTGEHAEGNMIVSRWKSEIPVAVAGFAYGDYKVYNDKAGSVAVEVYANREPDDVMKPLEYGATMGSVAPSNMAKTMGIEMANTVRLFESYFGPFPYKNLAITSLPISYSYGQGWPGLIYLWSVSFLDSTQRHQLGITDQTALTDFFRAHESSHQWWGHRVGWKSYHDQWLSEGFAQFSGNLYVQYRQNMKEYLSRWRKEKELLRTKDTHGHTIESLGPIWLGLRIASSETDRGSYQDLIYSKGGYVLHMLRMLLYDSRNPDPDHLFKDMMQDYCKTFDNKPASTEDFKAMVEKHMTRGMDLDGNHKMDWFFNQYVYGTGIPLYSWHYSVENTPEGKTHLKGTLTRAGVPEDWKDAVPLYAHVGEKAYRLGTIAVKSANTPVEVSFADKLERFTICDNEDMLADVKQ